MKIYEFIIIIAVIMLLSITFTGCASVNPTPEGGVESVAFLKDVTLYEQYAFDAKGTPLYDPNGRQLLKARAMSTKSNTASIMAGFTDFIGTAAGAAKSAIP